MEMLGIAVLLGLSLALILTAKVVEILDMSHEKLLWFGVLFCFAAAAPWLILVAVPWFILKAKEDVPTFLAWFGYGFLFVTVFDLIAASQLKGKVIPPCVSVKRPGKGRVARSAKTVAFLWLIPVVWYFTATGSLPSLGQMSGWDMLAYGFFTMAVIIFGFHSQFRRVEICGNGLLDGVCSPPMLKPWEAYESFSSTEETQEGVELRLQAKSADKETTPLMVRPEDREVVQQILEANLPDRLSGAHDGLNRRIPSPCIRVKRTRRRRFARHIVSVLCWPAVVLLLVYLWERSASWETFSVVGFLSIMMTMGVNFWPSKIIEICRNGLLLGDKLRAWEEYECFFWKGETDDGVELRLPLKEWETTRSIATTRLLVAPEDREAVQQLLLEANLEDRSTDSAAYSRWFRFFS